MKTDKRFRKYEFASKQEALDKIEALHLENELLSKTETIVIVDDVETTIIEDKSLRYLGLVHLGFIQTKEGTYDEQGNEIKAPTFSDMYSVDIFWKTDEPESWKGKKIKLNGRKNSHIFADIEYEDEL